MPKAPAKPARKKEPKKKVAASDARAVTAEIVESQPQAARANTVTPPGKTGLVNLLHTKAAPKNKRPAKIDGLQTKARGARVTSDTDDDFQDDFQDGLQNDEPLESPLARGPTDDDLEEMEDGAELDSNLPDIVASALPVKKSVATKDAAVGVSSIDPVTTYLAEIRKYGLLTREQEHELAIQYREHGDSKAAELLVTSNLRFVVKVAAEYSRFGAKLIDLIQEGNVGLMHAVREYNPYKGVRLITYAVWWIRGYIQEYLMRQYSMVRIGTTQNQRKLFYRLQKERDLLDSLGKDATPALLSSRLGVTEEEVATMTKRMSGRDLSLSQPVDSGGDSVATLLDFEASDEPNAEMQIGNAEELNVLKDNIAELRPRLSEKELYILDERILADNPLTLQEIGEHYGTTREAVRQLEARLIGKIRAAVTESLEHDVSHSVGSSGDDDDVD